MHELATWRDGMGAFDPGATTGWSTPPCVDEDYTETPDEQHEIDLLMGGLDPHPIGWTCSCGDRGDLR